MHVGAEAAGILLGARANHDAVDEIKRMPLYVTALAFWHPWVRNLDKGQRLLQKMKNEWHARILDPWIAPSIACKSTTFIQIPEPRSSHGLLGCTVILDVDDFRVKSNTSSELSNCGLHHLRRGRRLLFKIEHHARFLEA